MTTMIHHLPEPTTEGSAALSRATGNPDDIRTHPVSLDGRKRARACLIMNHSFTRVGIRAEKPSPKQLLAGRPSRLA